MCLGWSIDFLRSCKRVECNSVIKYRFFSKYLIKPYLFPWILLFGFSPKASFVSVAKVFVYICQPVSETVWFLSGSLNAQSMCLATGFTSRLKTFYCLIPCKKRDNLVKCRNSDFRKMFGLKCVKILFYLVKCSVHSSVNLNQPNVCVLRNGLGNMLSALFSVLLLPDTFELHIAPLCDWFRPFWSPASVYCFYESDPCMDECYDVLCCHSSQELKWHWQSCTENPCI